MIPLPKKPKEDSFEDETFSVFGRPSKYPESDEDIRKLHLDVMDYGRQGYSMVQIAVALEISRSTFYLWIEKHKAFSDTVKAARDASQAFWETMGMKLAKSGEGNATAYIFQMKNRFRDDYKDYKAIDLSSSDGTMTPQQTIYQLPDNGRGDN